MRRGLNTHQYQYSLPPALMFISHQHQYLLYIKHLRDVLNAFGEKSIVYTHALANTSLQAIAMYAIRAFIDTLAAASVLAPSIKMFDAQDWECVYDDVHLITY